MLNSFHFIIQKKIKKEKVMKELKMERTLQEGKPLKLLEGKNTEQNLESKYNSLKKQKTNKKKPVYYSVE